MKKKIIIGISILIVIIAIALVLFFVFRNHDEEVELSDALKFAEEYTEVGEDNVFLYRNADEIIRILENGTGVVYLGFSECKWCQKYVTYLNEAAKDNNITRIYYLDILDLE